MVTASVVVPAREEPTRLERTLDSLAGQAFDGDLEVIVVACGESTLSAARAHPVVDRALVDDARNGPGAARNRGAAAATGQLLLFTDADTVVPPQWVRRHRRHYATPEVVGVGGFDDSLAFLEDTDLSLRLREAGTLVYDHTCPVATSVRRHEREGYLPLFRAYLVGYLEYAIPGRAPTRAHFSRRYPDHTIR